MCYMGACVTAAHQRRRSPSVATVVYLPLRIHWWQRRMESLRNLLHLRLGRRCGLPHCVHLEHNLVRHSLGIVVQATLSLAISPDGALLAVGCLDKRMRLFQLQVPTSDIGPAAGTSRQVAARDWVGFDGPVAIVRWSANGCWLAAAGGTALLVVPRQLKAGEPPIRCVVPSPTVKTNFGDLSWSVTNLAPRLISAPCALAVFMLVNAGAGALLLLLLLLAPSRTASRCWQQSTYLQATRTCFAWGMVVLTRACPALLHR
jgi:hypothetical protein